MEIDGLTEGPASTVNLALKQIPDDESIIVANSDQYIFTDLSGFISNVRRGKSDGQILTMQASSNAWSYVGRDDDGKVNRVIEKVEISNEATVGVYGWNKARVARESFLDTFQNNIRTNNEFYVAPTYNYLIRNGLQVETFSVGKHGSAVHGLGTPLDLDAFLKLPESVRIGKLFQKKFEN